MRDVARSAAIVPALVNKAEAKLPSAEQPTFAELATRLQALLVKTDPEIPPIVVPPPIVGTAPQVAVNYSALLNQSMQQLVIAALPLMRSPSAESDLGSPNSPLCHNPLTPRSGLSRRDSFSSSCSLHSERSSFSEAAVSDDASNWRDTWGSNTSYDSLRSETGKRRGRGSLHLTPRRFPGKTRSLRRALDVSPVAIDLSEDQADEYSKSDHVVDVKPDPNESP